MFKTGWRQCAEDLRRGAVRTRCPNQAVYGHYCQDHGTPPSDNPTKSR